MSRSLGSLRRSGLVALGAVICAGALGACGTDPQGSGAGRAGVVHTTDDGFAGSLVQDPPLRPADVVLRDTHDKPYHLGRPSPDRVTVLFFGFTNCDDICPTTTADLAAARRVLPAGLAERVEVVFVTVDPRRDTAPVLERWLGRFDKGFVGLRGPMAVVHRAERSLYTMQSTVEPSTGGGHHHSGHSASGSHGTGYEVSHSGLVYAFGPGGESLYYSGGTTATEYAKDFARLLASP